MRVSVGGKVQQRESVEGKWEFVLFKSKLIMYFYVHSRPAHANFNYKMDVSDLEQNSPLLWD